MTVGSGLPFASARPAYLPLAMSASIMPRKKFDGALTLLPPVLLTLLSPLLPP